MARAPGALERLDLADEDAVHQGRGPRRWRPCRDGVRRLLLRVCGPAVEHGARVAHPLAHRDRVEPLVAGQLLDREELPHVGPPIEPGPAMPPASSMSFCSRA